MVKGLPVETVDWNAESTGNPFTMGLASLLASQSRSSAQSNDGPVLPHFAPRAKRVIYLFQSGAPSQIELFDYKPTLNRMFGQELPESVRQGQRLTGMTAGQSSFPMAGS